MILEQLLELGLTTINLLNKTSLTAIESYKKKQLFNGMVIPCSGIRNILYIYFLTSNYKLPFLKLFALKKEKEKESL